MNLAVFDFDGTLTRKDSLFAFLRFYSGYSKYLLKLVMLLPVFIGYAIGFIPNWKAKQQVLISFLGGDSAVEFQAQCDNFAKEIIPRLIRPTANNCIMQHLKQGDRVIVISASPENWILPWAQRYGFEVIGTKLETVDNKLTGKFFGKNCYGPEKVNRLKQYLDLEDYVTIFAYGDSKGDLELLSISDVPEYKPFR